MSNKKTVFLFMFMLLLVFFSVGEAKANESKASVFPKQTNKIDSAFENLLEHVEGSYKMGYLAEKYLHAWQQEFDNAATLLETKYKYPQDKEALQSYKKSVEKMADEAARLAWVNWADFDQPVKNRNYSTGTAIESMLGKMMVYRQAAGYLITCYESATGEAYEYIYKTNEEDFKDFKNK